ncbi:MAG TPA: NAD(P)-dependent oxidoreductase, partial [bacterium]
MTFDPALLPVPRYPCDHAGRPLQRSPEDERRWRTYLAAAEVMFDFDYPNLATLGSLIPRVRWIQATSTGIGQLLRRTGLIDTSIVFTTARGIHAKPLTDFTVMAILWFAKDGFRLIREQAARRWTRYCANDVQGATVGIVGFGSIGREVARACRALGMRILATKRTVLPGEQAPEADLLLPMDDLQSLLRSADYVVLAVPQTPRTDRLLGRDELAAMKPEAVLINVARGAVVDEGALIEALREGRLR